MHQIAQIYTYIFKSFPDDTIGPPKLIHDNCPKNRPVFPIFFWGGGTCPFPASRLLRQLKSCIGDVDIVYVVFASELSGASGKMISYSQVLSSKPIGI